MCAVWVLVYAYRLINRLSANEVYISSGRAEMDRSYPFDRASTTSRAIRIPSRSRAILLAFIPYSTSTIAIYNWVILLLFYKVPLRRAWRRQYNIKSSRQVEERKDVLKWNPIRFVWAEVKGSRSHPFSGTGCPWLPLIQNGSDSILVHFSVLPSMF